MIQLLIQLAIRMSCRTLILHNPPLQNPISDNNRLIELSLDTSFFLAPDVGYEPIEAFEKLTFAEASETDYLNTTNEMGHEDRIAPALAKVLYSRKHILNANDIRIH